MSDKTKPWEMRERFMPGAATAIEDQREFVDTNILLYALDRTSVNYRAAQNLIERLAATRSGCVSIQVLQEFYVNATRKYSLSADIALAYVERLSKWVVDSPQPLDVVTAIQVHRRFGISFWDAMVVSSARRQGCRIVWSEVLNDGQDYEGVVVRNPFLGS